ncbi:MAG TPA: SDR family oxidoreductase [Myxococcales bacterium]|jgi:NAD(P)-dependent dehydrogenase (short-subunit alcohol dehydrogenase family)|nr:SDR family oxidoreductase [Myxococcales bacterium]
MAKTNDPRRVLITGTSSGFGYLATKALAERGHTVYATMRGVDGANKAKADELRSWAKQGGHTVHVLELDVSNDASVAAGVKKAVETGGGIDALVNNAGVGTFGLHETFSAEQVARLFDVNVVGAFRVTNAVLPLMRETKAGQLIFIGSSLGRVVVPFMGPYGATKFAVEGLAEGIAFEVGPLGIDVTIIQPGAYATEFGTKGIQPAQANRMEQYGPVKDAVMGFGKWFGDMAASGQLGKPQEIADTILKVVETPRGERQLRVNVDAMLGQGVKAINDACAQVQQQTLASMGMGKK